MGSQTAPDLPLGAASHVGLRHARMFRGLMEGLGWESHQILIDFSFSSHTASGASIGQHC